MNATKLLVLLFLAITATGSMNAQQSTISLKIGATRMFNAPASSSKEFVYKSIAPHSPYPALHLEYRKEKFFNDRVSLLAGISGIPTFGEIALNEKNIRSGYSSSSRNSYYSLQSYIGLELSLRNPAKESFRNYFSVIASVGFNLSAGNDLDPEILHDAAITHSGESFSGARFTVEQGKLFSPSVQGGVRYHITNKNGKEIVILELQMNYNPTRYFSYTFRYNINGVDRVDYVAEKGFNLQFNVIIPLFNTNNANRYKR